MDAVIQLIRKASAPSAALQSGKLCFTLTINCIRVIFVYGLKFRIHIFQMNTLDMKQHNMFLVWFC